MMPEKLTPEKDLTDLVESYDKNKFGLGWYWTARAIFVLALQVAQIARTLSNSTGPGGVLMVRKQGMN